MRVHFEITFDTPPVRGRPRTLIGLGAIAVAVLLPAAVLAGHTFTDVPNGHTFHTNIANLAGAGVTAGCGATTYCPDEPVTRGQMAAFLNRGLGRVAIAEFNSAGAGSTAIVVGSVTITPGTSSLGDPDARQFVRAEFTGTIQYDAITGCPCTNRVDLLHEGFAITNREVAVTVETDRWYPISIVGVFPVTGSAPVTIDVLSQRSSGSTSENYGIFGTLIAETIPFGSTGTSAP